MEILNTPQQMKKWSRARIRGDKTIGFVPTMGYLHEGHLSLMRQSTRAKRFSCCQHICESAPNSGETKISAATRKPRKPTLKKCEECGVDALFMPRNEDMYGDYFQTYVQVERVSGPLCGASRPGHFRGVATSRTEIVQSYSAYAAYFGEKDYQQLQVIKTMVRDLDLHVRVVGLSYS